MSGQPARLAVVTALTMGTVLATSGCLRPIQYPIEPGISASFTPTERAVSEEYAKTFCSVLEAEFGADWEACDRYVRMDVPYRAEPLDDIPSGWTLLRVGGFGAQCLADVAETFADAGDHLAGTHGVIQHHVPLGAFDSSERNAERIRAFITNLAGSHQFIVVAHSKGAADMMVALTKFPADLRNVRALITVAGAVGGSYLVDDLEKLNRDVLRRLGLPTCLSDAGVPGANAIDSMRRTNRQQFLADHVRLDVPAF
jgi:pimeloyl-ACP methyl ester carboxylesterase